MVRWCLRKQRVNGGLVPDRDQRLFVVDTNAVLKSLRHGPCRESGETYGPVLRTKHLNA